MSMQPALRLTFLQHKLYLLVSNERIDSMQQGTGFPHAERERLGVRGLLPPGTLSMERQVTC